MIQGQLGSQATHFEILGPIQPGLDNGAARPVKNIFQGSRSRT